MISRYAFECKFDHLNNAVEIKKILADIKGNKIQYLNGIEEIEEEEKCEDSAHGS